MALFRSSAPSYAYEELNHSLTALSTIPVSIPATLIANENESSSSTPVIRAALRDLSASKPITRSKLVNVLKTIADTQEQAPGAASSAGGLVAYNAIDKVMEAEITALYDARFWRMWRFYLAGAIAAFQHDGHLVYQLQLTKKRDAAPLVRDYIGAVEPELRRVSLPG